MILRTSVKTKNKIDLNKLVSILDFQLELMNSDLMGQPDSSDEIFKSVLEVQVLDKIYEKYNVEEEDILIALKGKEKFFPYEVEHGENEKVKEMMSKF